MEDDGFTLVTTKHKRCFRRSQLRPSSKNALEVVRKEFNGISDLPLHVIKSQAESSFERILVLKNSLLKSHMWNHFKDVILTHLLSQSIWRAAYEDQRLAFVVYGIGRVHHSMPSQDQLAFVLAVQEILKIREVEVYDPVFTPIDTFLCEEMAHMTVLMKNEMGCRVVNRPTLFFLPHCGKGLYENLLESNWSTSLSQLVILGNSVDCCTDSDIQNTLARDFPCLYKVYDHKLAHEIRMQCGTPFDVSFNHTSYHFFYKEKLKQQPSTFWKLNSNLRKERKDPEMMLE